MTQLSESVRSPMQTKKPSSGLRRSSSPAFFLEMEIGIPKMGLWSVLSGMLVLIAMKLLFSLTVRPVPSLITLIAMASGSAGMYMGIRALTFQVALGRARKAYPKNPKGMVVRGNELPRNAFLLVTVLPVTSIPLMCLALYELGVAFGPKMWIVIAVGTAISLRDLIAAGHVLLVGPSRWIRETQRGLDVLLPMEAVGDLQKPGKL
ncbi:hypothetical protein [Desulfomonile tiedjei]|uniref:Uncharacterized protein n=1 Tax=Desulfomonile tiedjei (strain ATCC 49306 / DSM 6799 / DCB-1) TaxID=706587 RepID=I4C7X5_DESTA|nr:hypothetical protein [Desulfomonile tiedjei]AFM25666.1 hypothetical protein Desti_3000 [Desulfomonile tiedjei DSM 6799]